jgi:hypothetical protein
VIATSRHEKRQKKGRQQQQQQRKGNTPELDDAGTGNPRQLGNLMRGMRIASAITAASSLSLSLSFREPQAIRSLFLLLKHKGRPDVASSWHRQVKLIGRGLAGVSPALHLGSNPDPFFEVPEWAIPVSHHPWSPNSIVDCFRSGFSFVGKDN